MPNLEAATAALGVSVNDRRKNLRDLNGHMDRECASSAARYGITLEASLMTGIDPLDEVEKTIEGEADITLVPRAQTGSNALLAAQEATARGVPATWRIARGGRLGAAGSAPGSRTGRGWRRKFLREC